MRAALAVLLTLPPLLAAPVTIENDRIAVTVDAERKGAITSLRDKIAGRELLADGQAPRLFQAEYTTADQLAGQKQTISEQDADRADVERTGDGLTITLTSTKPALRSATVTFRTQSGSPFIRATINLDFDPALRLHGIRFPHLAHRLLADDALVTGATKGGIRKPSEWKAGGGLYLTQPGSLAAPFATYYDAQGGLMFAALDSRARPKMLGFSRGDGYLSIQGYTSDFASPPHPLGYEFALTCLKPRDDGTAADWHDAADLYKAWAVTQPWCSTKLADRKDLPGWLKDAPVMVRFNRGWLAEPDSIRDWLKHVWAEKYPDAPLVVAFWGWEKIDTWVTPDYFPVFPSDEQFIALNRDIQAAAGHPFCWPSGYHYTTTFRKLPDETFQWDDRARFDREIRSHAIQNADGTTYLRKPSWLQGGETSAICPGDPWGLDWFNQIGAELAKRGSEIVQIDQVVGGRFPACWSTTHGHPPGPGPWQADVFQQQLEQLRRVVRTYQPDGFVGVEEPNEVFIQQVGVQDYRDWEVMRGSGTMPASVFQYLYHEYLPCFQSNPQAGNKVSIAWQIATGQMPHLVPSKYDGPGPALVNGTLDPWSGAAPVGWDKVSGWQNTVYSGKAERDTAEKHEGEASLKLTNGPDDPVVQVSQNVNVGRGIEIGQTYRLRAWLRNGGMKQDNAINASMLGPGLKGLGGVRLAFGKPDEGWVERTGEFTVAKGTELLRIMINLAGEGSGWVDDLRLEEKTADGWREAPRPDTPNDYELTRRWVELYHGEARPYLAHGKMLPPPALRCGSFELGGQTFPAVFHNAYEAADGSRALVLVNATADIQEGTLTVAGKPVKLTLAPWEIVLRRM